MMHTVIPALIRFVDTIVYRVAYFLLPIYSVVSLHALPFTVKSWSAFVSQQINFPMNCYKSEPICK